MATRRKPEPEPTRRRRPAMTPEDDENRMISLAVSCVEKQMREGTASSQVLTHYLKLGSSRERHEQRRLRGEIQLLEAKVENLQSQQRSEELFEEAINAMRTYSGRGDEDDY